MDNSVDTNVLVDSTPTCSSTQVMNLGAVVPTDPTTCTTVSMLSNSVVICPGNLAKPVGGAVLEDKIYLLTNKSYALNELRFGYACIITNADNSTCTRFTPYDSYINSDNIHGISTISYGDDSQYQSLSFSNTGLSIDVNSLCVKSPNLNGCISFKEKEPGSFESTINIDSCIINTCSGSLCIHFIDNLCITDSNLSTIFSSEYGSTFVGCNSGGELYAGGFSIYLDFSYDFYIRNVSNDYNPIMSFSYDTLEIDTSLYSDTTKQGTYEVTKGISNVGINKTDNTPYIPDLVNRIFKYSGTVTSFSAKPKYTNQMKDNVLYEFEVWHTIPDASGVTYTSPKNVEWLYGDPAESGIELTDGITLYYAFRAFKSGTDVIVQGNLYATTTPQVSQE
jgi:hypothetical protein